MSILSLSCSGCKHGRLKSQFSPASVLHLFSQFDLLLFSLTRGWGALHAHTRIQGYSTLSEEGGCVGVRIFLWGSVWSQPLCAMERVSDVQNNRGGKECYAQFCLHYYKKKRGSFQVFNVWCRNRTVSSTTQYILHVPKYILFKGFSLECAQYR